MQNVKCFHSCGAEHNNIDNLNIMKKSQDRAGAIILGMHDALVSLTGLISGLTFALANQKIIILSAIIASATAALSMGASEYIAEKTRHNKHAICTGAITGMAYAITCVVLLIPFYITANTKIALFVSYAIVVLMIFLCNFCIRHAHNRRWWRHAIEMLIICTTVSVVAFIIGDVANKTLGINI